MPVLIAAPAGTRVRLAVTCAALTAALTSRCWPRDPGRFHAAQDKSAWEQLPNTVTAHERVVAVRLGPRSAKASTGSATRRRSAVLAAGQRRAAVLHLGVIGVALLLSLLYARRRGRGNPDDVLQLVALLFLRAACSTRSRSATTTRRS